MPRPAFILVHPGSLAAHGGQEALEAALVEFEAHDGPLVVIDGFLSDIPPSIMRSYNLRLDQAFAAAESKGEFAIRVWGCDAGEEPFDAWYGYASPGVAIDTIYDGQEVAAKWIEPILRSRDAILTGAWATKDDSSGCVNSVATALKSAGWPGKSTISQTALFEEEAL